LFTGKERRIPFIFDDFHSFRSRVIGLDMTENMILKLPPVSDVLGVAFVELSVIIILLTGISRAVAAT
jgi:hypothetical protein